MPVQSTFNSQNIIKITMFSNAAWIQRVRLVVPPRPSATLGGPGPDLPAIDQTWTGSGEGNVNFGSIEVDTGANATIFTFQFDHSPDGGATWVQSMVRVNDTNDVTYLLAEDGADDDFNDTILKAEKHPYFTLAARAKNTHK